MDNRIFSIIKRSMLVMKSYATTLVLFCTLSGAVMAFDSAASIMPWFSFIMFLLMFMLLYTDMRNTAFKEKRPQYFINPPPFKGILYGIIGIIPILLLQTVVLLVSVPEDYSMAKWRAFQVISGPVYWIARILGNKPAFYMAAMILIIIIAFLGYYAGHHNFYIAEWVRKRLGIKKSAIKPKAPRRQGTDRSNIS